LGVAKRINAVISLRVNVRNSLSKEKFVLILNLFH